MATSERISIQSHSLNHTHTHTHSPAFVCVCRDLGSASISSFGPVLKNKAGSSFLQWWPRRRQRHLLSENVPAVAGGCVFFTRSGRNILKAERLGQKQSGGRRRTHYKRLLLRVYLFYVCVFFCLSGVKSKLTSNAPRVRLPISVSPLDGSFVLGCCCQTNSSRWNTCLPTCFGILFCLGLN